MIAPLRGIGIPAFSVSVTASDAARAQWATRTLADRFVEEKTGAILEPASLPVRPTNPGRFPMMLFGFIMGVLAGALFALFTGRRFGSSRRRWELWERFWHGGHVCYSGSLQIGGGDSGQRFERSAALSQRRQLAMPVSMRLLRNSICTQTIRKQGRKCGSICALSPFRRVSRFRLPGRLRFRF